MGDYNIAFKFNERIVKDNRAYAFPDTKNKYALDRKML